MKNNMEAFLRAVLLLAILPTAAPAHAGWDQFDLEQTEVHGIPVYHEKSLGDKMSDFSRIYAKHASEKDCADIFLASMDAIIADIRETTGHAVRDQEQKMFQSIAELMRMRVKAFYVVTKPAVKDFLRSGGQLPYFSYDSKSNTADCKFELTFGVSSDAPIGTGLPNIELPVLVSSPGTFDEDVENTLKGITMMLCSIMGMAIHEAVEASMLVRLMPEDPWWRWFSDGFANAVTYELLKKHIGMKQAEVFMVGYDPAKYADLEKELNLRYWMGESWCVKTPLKTEERLVYARYAHATYEARYLVDEHGLGCVKRILDVACTGKRNSSERLYEAIEQVTGVDMRKRLLRYQNFGERNEGRRMYMGRINKAWSKKDHETMLVNALRVLELHDHLLSPQSLETRSKIIMLLYKLGYEEYGDGAILDCLKLFRQLEPTIRCTFMKLFLHYSLEWYNPQKSLLVAEEILKESPEHVISLMVKMLAFKAQGKEAEAKQTAEKILTVETDKESVAYKAATAFLAEAGSAGR